MRRFKKWLIGFVIFWVLFTVAGFFVLPPLLKSVLTRKLSAALHREVTIGRLKTNPYTLSVTAYGFKVKERGGPEIFLSSDEIFLNLQSLSILKGALILRELKVTQPFLRMVRYPDGTYNFSDLIQKEEVKPEVKKKPFQFSFNNIQLLNGSIDFKDEPKQKEHTVRELNLTLPFLSNIPYEIEIFVEPALSMNVNGTSHALRGKAKPFSESRETEVEIEIADLDLPYYLAYLPVPFRAKIRSAFLDAKVKLAFLQPKDRPSSLSLGGEMSLKQVVIDELDDRPLFRLPRLDVAIASAEPLSRIFHLSKVLIQSPELEIRRSREGRINLTPLFAAKKEVPPSPEEGKSQRPFLLEIDEASIEGGKVTLTDLSRSRPFKTVLGPIALKVDHFSNDMGKTTAYALSTRTEANEEMKAEGTLCLDPFQGEGAIEVRSVPLRKYSPYYAENFLFDVEEGSIDLGARYRYSKQEKEIGLTVAGVSLSLRSLRLRNRESAEEFLKVPLVVVKDGEVDLPGRDLRVGDLSTERGIVTFHRLKSGELDLPKLFVPVEKEGKPLAEAGKKENPWRLTFGRIKLDQYTLIMNDETLSMPATVLGEKLNLIGENLSSEKGKMGRVSFTLLLDKKTSVSVRSNFGLDPLRTEGVLEVKHLSLRQYSPYYQDHVLFELEEGDLDLSTNYQFSKSEKDLGLKLSRLSASVRSLKARRKGGGEEFVAIPWFSLKETSMDLSKKELVLGEISTEKGWVLVKREKNGELNLLKLLSPSRGQETRTSKDQTEPSPKSWLVKAGKLGLSQYRVTVEDEAAFEPVRLAIEEMDLRAENLSMAKGHRGNVSLSFRLNEKGTIAVSGLLGIDPLYANLKVTLKEVPIGPWQPYFTDKVRVMVTDGYFTTTGTLLVSEDEEKRLRLTYQGESAVSNFSSIDKVTAEDFLKWESLTLSGIDLGYNPLYFRVAGVALTQFYSRLMVYADGSTNLQNIFEGKEGTKSSQGSPPQNEALPAKEGEPGKKEGGMRGIGIERVTFQGGHINFTDNYIKPNYSVNLLEIGGRISGLSSESGSSADVELRGMWENVAPFEVTGKVNPLSKDLFLDLTVKLKDFDLPPLTPYSGKYVGYKVEKGKLAMDLKYLILKRKLDAQNKIFLDQLTLGDPVESPDATKLPVRLAIALLKDRKGEIRLDIPVTGSLDDPKFSLFRIVLQIILNLLTKAATSPFALLGAIFGGGEQLDHLEFDYGTADLKGENTKKLETLMNLLHERPGIRLEIEGHVDLEKDREGLKRLFFDRKIKAQKLKELVKKGQPTMPIDEVKIDPPEYPKYLKLAYKEEKFPKPKNWIGLDKDIPAPEMEKLMLTHIEVGEGELRALASQRALKVRDFLVQSGKVEPERLFLIEPKSLSPEKKEKLKDSRVNFRLK